MADLNINLALAKINAQIQNERDLREESYKNFPDVNRYFAFVDLASNSNYRIAKGSEKGYFRTETFFSLIKSTIDPNPDVNLMKEIGDEGLLVSPEFRPLFESLILINQMAKEMELVAGDERFPFKIRMAISGGIVKKLKRGKEDYVGKCIDQLARLMGIRSESSNFIIHETLYSISGIKEIIGEYDFIFLSDEIPLSNTASKNMLEKVYYKEIKIDSPKLSEYRKNFKYW